MSHSLATQVGKRMKAARLRTSLTQEEVAEKLGLGRSGYSNIENGRSMLSIDHLLMLPEIIGESVNYYLGVDTPDDSDRILEFYNSYQENAAKYGAPEIDVLETMKKILQVSKEAQLRILDFINEIYDTELSAAISTLTEDERRRLLARLHRKNRGEGEEDED